MHGLHLISAFYIKQALLALQHQELPGHHAAQVLTCCAACRAAFRQDAAQQQPASCRPTVPGSIGGTAAVLPPAQEAEPADA